VRVHVILQIIICCVTAGAEEFAEPVEVMPFAGLSVAAEGTVAIPAGSPVATPSMSDDVGSVMKPRRLASSAAVQKAQHETLQMLITRVKEAVLFNETFVPPVPAAEHKGPAAEQKGFGLASAPTLKLDMRLPEDSKIFDRMLEPVRWLIDDVDDYVHGFSTCASESFNNRRLVYASKNREYTKSFDGRSKFSALIHNTGIDEACIAVASCIGLHFGNFSIASLEAIAARRAAAADKEKGAKLKQQRKRTEKATAARLSLETAEAKGTAIGGYVSMAALQPNAGSKKRKRSSSGKRLTNLRKRELFALGDPSVWQCQHCKRLYAASSKATHPDKCSSKSNDDRAHKKPKPSDGDSSVRANAPPENVENDVVMVAPPENVAPLQNSGSTKTASSMCTLPSSGKDEKVENSGSKRKTTKPRRQRNDEEDSDDDVIVIENASESRARKSSRRAPRVTYLPVDEDEFDEWEDASHLLFS